MLVVYYEKLAAICVRSTVGHGHNAALSVLEGVINFVWKFPIGGWVYAFAALACASRITSLHISGQDAVDCSTVCQ